MKDFGLFGERLQATDVVGPGNFGDASSVGTSLEDARADHYHGLPAAPSSALSNSNNKRSTNVTMTNANQYYDGPQLSLIAGTWFVSGNVTILPGGVGQFTAKIWDGTLNYASGEQLFDDAVGTIHLSTIITLGSTTTVRLAAAGNIAGGIIRAAAVTNAAGNTASQLSAIKIA